MVNLVSIVMQFLTPEMIGRIASALGLERASVQSAVGAAVPALLAGFSGVAARPGGPQELVNAAKQETGTLGKSLPTRLAPGPKPRAHRARPLPMLASLLRRSRSNCASRRGGW